MPSHVQEFFNGIDPFATFGIREDSIGAGTGSLSRGMRHTAFQGGAPIITSGVCWSIYSTWWYSVPVRQVFKTKTFGRWSRKARISDEVLCLAVEEMTRGLIDADLGGRVFKKRIPVPGRGKRGGARSIVGSNLQDRWFFLYGFEKKDRETIDSKELAALQAIAGALLRMEPKSLLKAVVENELEEICDEEEPPTQ